MDGLRVRNQLNRKKSFWLFKKWLEEKPLFGLLQNRYRIKRSFDDSKNSFRLLWPTLPDFLKTAAYSAFIIFVFEAYGRFFPLSTNFVETLLDKNAVDSLLTSIASIAGVFLGLYFTAIPSIASNLLVRATQDIRKLFLSSPLGRQYVRTVALTGIISVFYLVTKSLGHTIHPVGLVCLALLAAYIIIRFWSIGSDVFNSLEPSSSFPWITRDVADSVKAATPPGFQWRNPNIQNHHRKLAAGQLELARNLISFGIAELKLPDDQLVLGLRYLGGLLCFYPGKKRRIPTGSFWYRTKVQYENWAFVDSTKITLALNTGTTIQPKSIKDLIWFETDISDIIKDILSHFVKEKHLGAIYEGVSVFVEVMEVYAEDFDEDACRMLFKKIEQATASVYLIPAEEAQTQREKLAFVDAEGSLAVGALLGLSRHLDKRDCVQIVDAISKVRWEKGGKDIYLTGLPSAVVSRLETTFEAVKNEIRIEGKRVSPDWYIRTLIVQQYLFSLQKYFNYIKSLHKEYFLIKLEKLLAAKQFPLAVHLVQRWMEFTNKYSRLVYMVNKQMTDCSPHHQVRDLPWPVFDFEAEKNLAEAMEKEVADRLTDLLPELQSLVPDDTLPDYFGQALMIGVQACYQACRDNDPLRLGRLLPKVFSGSLAAHEVAKKKVESWSQMDSKIIFSTEPLINLLEISGYAKLYAEFWQNQALWQVAQELWDRYLSLVNAPEVIKYIAAICSYRDSVFSIKPQDTLRIDWQMKFENEMREKGIPVFPDAGAEDPFSSETRPTHPSPLIRVLIRYGGLRTMLKGQTVFFATYLSSHPGAKDVELPDKRDLAEQIARELQREQGAETADDESHE